MAGYIGGKAVNLSTSGADISGTANLDIVDIDGAVDMATTALVTGVLTTTAAPVFNGGFTANDGSTITTADNSDNLTLVSTDADAVSGPNVNFYRNSGSPADNDHLGEIRFTGRNDNSQDVVYANIETRIKDASDGTEDGYFDFETMIAGTLQSRLIMNETATVFNEDSLDLDFRVESNNHTDALFVDAGDDKTYFGKSSSALSAGGIEAHPTGRFMATYDGGLVGQFNRLSNDGDILAFYKDGTVVGSIGIQSYGFEINGESNHTGWSFGNNTYIPLDNGARVDNNNDLGSATYRFDDIFATNGTIQTSDRNEKQDIAALTSAEMLVAKRISALFKTFRWRDKVAEKGANARTHTGIIAQDVQAAFTAEGLEVGNYSLFISATWWETQTDVPAVEADEDNDIEAKEAYTRTDTFDTLDEAPEGATERTRMGIRYPELLSFVAAYNEQRFASIETRLTALEEV